MAKSPIWPLDVTYNLKIMTKSFPPSEFIGPKLVDPNFGPKLS